MKLLKFCGVLVFMVLTFSKFSQAQTSAVDTLNEYPNPFSTIAYISFDLVDADTVTLQLFNALGQTVALIFDHVALPSGSYLINYDGSALPNGIYLLRLSLTQNTFIKRIVKLGESSSTHQPVSTRSILLMPNPTTSQLQIPIDGNKKIIVTNIIGQIVLELETTSTTFSINELSTGEYIVNIFNNNEQLILSQKIIKTD